MIEVGKASIFDDFAGIELMIFATSSTVDRISEVSCAPMKTASVAVASDVASQLNCYSIVDFMFAILMAK
jgi:hypothetical protein